MKNELKTTKKTTKKSRLQQRYESLLKDIEVNKSLQETLTNDLRKVIPRIEKEMHPLLRQRTEAVRKRVLRLDELADELGVGKINIEWFAPYIADEAMTLLQNKNFQDDELIEIYEKYTGESPLPDKEQFDDLAATVKEMYGFDIDVEELMKQGMENYMSENAENFRKQAAEKQEQEEAQEVEDFAKQGEKKVNKQEQMLAQDAKTIYLRLVKKFHPDLEQDETLKIQKTALVQEVTKAYKENDFLKLLSLQIEHIDEKENEGQILADDMFKRYNKILTKQLNELKYEIEDIKYASNGIFEDFFDKNSKFSERRFKAYKKRIQTEIDQIEADTRNSYKRKKGWFKDWMREIKDFTTNQMMEEALANLFSNIKL